MASLNESFSSEALDIDESILEQVKKAIIRVAAAECSDRESDLPSSAQHHQAPDAISEMIEKQHQELEDQVMSLKAEIKVLEEELSRRRKIHDGEKIDHDKELERTILSLVAGGGATEHLYSEKNGEDLLSRLLEAEGKEEDNEYQKLESQIRLNKATSGIKFESADWEIIRKDDTCLLREHTHVGSTLGYSFRVIFVVSEEKSEMSSSNDHTNLNARIVVMRVEVDPKAQRNMEDFLARVCGDCDLMLFYQTYSRCCLFLDERRKAFKEAKSKFQESIHFGEIPSRLHFSIQKGLSLNFNWSLSVSTLGVVDRSISLQIKMPSNASSHVSESFSRMPQLLNKMILLHGHRKGFTELLNLFLPAEA